MDVWPILLSRSSYSPREYLPTTEHSLIWQSHGRTAVGGARAAKSVSPILLKLITAAGRDGWYPPALGYNMSGKLEANEEQWPCVGNTSSSFFGGECTVCSESKPCLFDLSDDEGERVNLASQNPEIVAKLTEQLKTYCVRSKGYGTTSLYI